MAKKVASLRLLGADVVGYMEMENDGYGPTARCRRSSTPSTPSTAPGTWAFIDPDAAPAWSNVAGTDAIKAGVLYRPASVTPVGDDAVLNTATFVDATTTRAAPAGRPDLRDRDRRRFTVVANHFKSKGRARDRPGHRRR